MTSWIKLWLTTQGRTLALIAVLLPLLGLFAWVALRAGPLAPVPVQVARVEVEALTPALFGLGLVEASATHRIGSTSAGRILRLHVQPGDHVKAGQVLGELDSVDLDDKIQAQDAAMKRTEASVQAAQAQLQELSARQVFADAQVQRYEALLSAQSITAEAMAIKQQERVLAQAGVSTARANLEAIRQEGLRLKADREGLLRQRANLRLVSPIDGLVTRRDVDPGTTVVAGQSVVEVVDPHSVWLHARFDQQRAVGLQPGLAVKIVLRSQGREAMNGHIVRIEPHADAVTEEVLAKVIFDQLPDPLPPLGESAEITVALAVQPKRPVISNASVQRVEGQLGVWQVEEASGLRFVPIRMGATDLEGRVQVLAGLQGGENVVTHSHKALDARSRIKVVERVLP
jgi:RND family efflux transporter MFP subunit